MSLKIVHAFFIAVSALMCIGVGVWRWSTMAPGDSAAIAQSLGAIAAGVGLLVYGVRFLVKYRELSNL